MRSLNFLVKELQDRIHISLKETSYTDEKGVIEVCDWSILGHVHPRSVNG